MKREHQEELETVYQATVDLISRHVFFKVRTLEDAQDIVSQVYIQYAQSIIMKNRTVDNVTAYLTTIANHLCVAYYKSKAKESVIISVDEDLIETVSDDTDVEEEAFDHIESEHLWKMVRQLSEMEQKILIGKFRFNQTFKELGEKLGLNENTVKVKYYRSLKKMKNMIEHETFFDSFDS